MSDRDERRARVYTPCAVPVTFAAPELLLLLPVLCLFVWLVGRRSLAGLESGRRRLALGARLLIVALFVLALAEVQWRDVTEKVDVIAVLDHSRSIPDAQVARGLAAIDAARKRMDPRRDSGKLVVFGREAFIEQRLTKDGPAVDRIASHLERGYSNLEEGVRRGLEAVETGTRGRIVLLTDGNQTVGEVSAAVARARAAQVPVDVIPLEYSHSKEVQVEKVVVPLEAKTGEPFIVRVVTQAAEKTPARIHLWREGALLESRDVVLEAGPNVEEFQLLLERPDFYRIEAVVEPLNKTGDQLFQNNTAHGFVFARGKAQVLFIHDETDQAASESRHLLEALANEQIRCVVTSAVNAPLEPMALQGYDAVILDNVERSALSENQQRAIEKACGDMGTGLIMIGGERSFGAGEWRGSPIEAALPVEMDIKQEETIPDGALVMIIHSCEFPDGNALAIKVCKKAVDGLSAKDWVGTLIYGPQGNQWAVPIQRAQNKPAIKQAIHGMEPADMPDFDGIFRMALQSLKTTTASVKHMILMSDGDPSMPASALLKECRDSRITVSTICYFSHDGAQGPSAQAMRRIANATGGKFYYLQNADDLPKIFIKEAQRVARSLISNQTFVPIVRSPSPVLTGLEGALPKLTGMVLTEAKPRADVPLVNQDMQPLLAHWQYGVGKSLAFTSDAKPRWGTSWVEWEGYRRFWSQCVRWVSKGVQESGFSVATATKGDRGQIVLDAVSDGEYVDGLEVAARVTTPQDGRVVEVKLRQRGSGRYEGDFPVDQVGTYTVNLITRDAEGKAQAGVTTGLVVPYSEEFRRLRSDRPFLDELARQGDGRVLPLQDVIDGKVDLWDREKLGQKVALEERWTWALALALLLFLVDVAARRVAIDWGKLWARGKALVTRSAAPAASTMDRLRERKAVVREERETLAKFTPSPTAPATPVDVAGSAALGGTPTPGTTPSGRQLTPPPKPPSATDKPGEAGGTFTNRLLEAKRRARGEQDTKTDKRDDAPGGPAAPG